MTTLGEIEQRDQCAYSIGAFLFPFTRSDLNVISDINMQAIISTEYIFLSFIVFPSLSCSCYCYEHFLHFNSNIGPSCLIDQKKAAVNDRFVRTKWSGHWNTLFFYVRVIRNNNTREKKNLCESHKSISCA